MNSKCNASDRLLLDTLSTSVSTALAFSTPSFMDTPDDLRLEEGQDSTPSSPVLDPNPMKEVRNFVPDYADMSFTPVYTSAGRCSEIRGGGEESTSL